MANEIILPRVTVIYQDKEAAIKKLDSINFSYGMPAIIRYREIGKIEPRCLFAIGLDSGIGKYRLLGGSGESDSGTFYQLEKQGTISDISFLIKCVSDPKPGDIAQIIKGSEKSYYIYDGRLWNDFMATVSATNILVESGRTLDSVLSDIFGSPDLIRNSEGKLIVKIQGALKRGTDGLYIGTDEESIIVNNDSNLQVGTINGGLI